jgi:hypothetical protein
MRIARALVLASLVPFLGIGVLGVGVGYRSLFGLGQFVLVWACVLCPLVVAIALAAYFIGPRVGLEARWHFSLGGLLAGSALAIGWFFYPMHNNFPVLPGVAVCGIAGAVGATTGVVFWRLAVAERAT